MTLPQFKEILNSCYAQLRPHVAIHMVLDKVRQTIDAYAQHIDADAIAYCVPDGFVIESFKRFVDPNEAELLGVRLCKEDHSKVMIRWSDLR